MLRGCDMRASCGVILPRVIQDDDKYRFGTTKIFFRAGQVAVLEKHRANVIRRSAVCIQVRLAPDPRHKTKKK